MPITINYQPAAGLVANAGYTGGLADYNRYMTTLAQRQSEQQQQERMQRRGIASQQYMQQYGVAADQYGQQVGIADTQTRQLRGFGEEQFVQQQNIADLQYRQQQALENDRAMQLNTIAAQRMNLVQQQQYDAQALQYKTAAGFQSQANAGGIDSYLSQQKFDQQQQLSSQYADQQAYLQDQQFQHRADLNRSNIQDQIDFAPQLSETEYQVQQQTLQRRTDALQGAMSSGLIGQTEFDAARRELLMQQTNLKQSMPVMSDASQDFQRRIVTANNGATDPVTGQSLRYIRNDKGSYDLDPSHELNFKMASVQEAVNQRKSADLAKAKNDVSKMAMDYAINAVKAATVSESAAPNFTSIYNEAYNAIMASYAASL